MTARRLAAVAALALLACESGRSGAQRPGAQTVRDGRATVTVEEDGYHPSTLDVPAGVPLTLTFKRTTSDTCGAELVFPTLNIRKELPLNQPVDVELTPRAGTIAFECGMRMLHGIIVAD